MYQGQHPTSGRSEAETTGLRGKRSAPDRGARNTTVDRFYDPSRVEPLPERVPGVAACGLTPGYYLATFQVAQNGALNRHAKGRG